MKWFLSILCVLAAPAITAAANLGAPGGFAVGIACGLIGGAVFMALDD